MNKRNIFFWVLYDFANSIVVVVFFLYFTQWLVIENKVSDLWYNLIFTGASLLLILTSPVLGTIADKVGRKLPFLNIITTLQFIFGMTAALVAVLAEPSSQTALIAGIAYLLTLYFYQLQFTFYNALLPQISTPANSGRISGIGQAANWLGQIAGILIALPFISGTLHLFGRPGRVQALIPGTVIFFLLSLPMMFGFRETQEKATARIDIKSEYKNFFRAFRDLILLPSVGVFLLGYFFFNDAILTVQNNFPILLQQVFQIDDKTKSFLLLGILVTSVFGALLGGWVGDKIGLKKTLMIILSSWLIFFPFFSLIKSFSVFVVLAIVLGILYGATWTVTRATMIRISPKANLNHALSYYTLAERFSTFLGPITWGIITSSLVTLGPTRYRLASLAMTIFIAIGIVCIKKIPERNLRIDK